MKDDIKGKSKRARYNEENRLKHEELEKLKENIVLEKNDVKALIIAALTTIFPFAIAIFVLVSLILWFLFT